MSAPVVKFSAINILEDSDSEEENEQIQELQVEQALKIYHKALKLHSNNDWEAAADAYDELHRTEVLSMNHDFAGLQKGSSLSSLVYLSNKTFGEFLLNRLEAEIKAGEKITEENIRDTLELALSLFARALEIDGGDSILWRRTAEIASALGQVPVARFCLESVLDPDSEVAHFSEQKLAGQRLKQILVEIHDDASLTDTRYARHLGKGLTPHLRHHINPYPWLPPLPKEDSLGETWATESENVVEMKVEARTWEAVGDSILEQLQQSEDAEELSEERQEAYWGRRIILPSDGTDTPEETPEVEKSEQEAMRESAIMEDGDTQMSEPLPPPQHQRGGSSSRKRKPSATNLTDDSGRARVSKRVRDRESMTLAQAAAAPPPVLTRDIMTQDEKFFKTVEECFAPFNLSLGTAEELKIKADDGATKTAQYIQDFKSILREWNDDKGNVILYGEGIPPPDEVAPGLPLGESSGSGSYGAHGNILQGESLGKWARAVNKKPKPLYELALSWLKSLAVSSLYTSHRWTERLKHIVFEVFSYCEETLLSYFKDLKSDWELNSSLRLSDEALQGPINILELCLGMLAETERGVYGVTGFSAEELKKLTKIQLWRTMRWRSLAHDFLQIANTDREEPFANQYNFRFLWAYAIISRFEGCSTDFMMDCFESLRDMLAESKQPKILLPNSGAMLEVSTQQAEREISKLKTVDFFGNIFEASAQMTDPERVILSLEAVLDPREESMSDWDEDVRGKLQEMSGFLEKSSSQFKLYLWGKLREAYQAFDAGRDEPRILTCCLKSLNMVVEDFVSQDYDAGSLSHRQFVLLRGLRHLDEIIALTLNLALKDRWNMADLSPELLQGALRSLVTLLRLLHVYSFYEDGIMNKEYRASDLHSYRLVIVKFKEMLVRSWSLAYLIFRELLQQQRPDHSDNVDEQLAQLLSDIHDELGVRSYCKMCDHVFLKMAQDEFLKFNLPEFHQDLVQCIQCRFHIHIGADTWTTYEHKTDIEPFTKKSALDLLDFVLGIANQKKVQQLPKSDIRVGIEKLVEVLGLPEKSVNPRAQVNKQAIETYLLSSIHPLQLQRSLKGGLHLSVLPFQDNISTVAGKGLYYLQAEIYYASAKYRKKNDRLRLDDAEKAVEYYKQDLICNGNRWGSWYKLAQVFEEELEDSMTWSADAMNNERDRLVELERKAILCYMMASSIVVELDDTKELRAEVTEMWTAFGYRIYSASRTPMSMESFWTDDFLRHFSGRNNEGLFTRQAHRELTRKQALIFAKTLFERALVFGSENWKNHYMLGKCFAKLEIEGYKTAEDEFLSPEDSLHCFVQAIKLLPTKEIIFEPHHKLVSTALKLVLDYKLEAARACEVIKDGTSFAKSLVPVSEREAFGEFAVAALQKMKAADKVKWHHRMTSRIARYLWDTKKDAEGALKEMSTLFSQKGSTLAIWRPDNERPGRHFVYASMYTMLYAILLNEVKDRVTLEGLARRVRKNASGFYQHAAVWDVVSRMYCKSLRELGDVPLAEEDNIVKTVSYDDFAKYSQKLEEHFSKPENSTPTYELLRDVSELRRLGMGTKAKHTEIDDLMNDAYAKLYLEYVPELVKKLAAETESRSNPMSVMNLVAASEEVPDRSAAGTPTPSQDGAVVKVKPSKVTKRDITTKVSSLVKQMVVKPPPAPAAGPSTSGGSNPVPNGQGQPPRSSPIRVQERGEDIDHAAGILLAAAGGGSSSPADTPMGSRGHSPVGDGMTDMSMVEAEDSTMMTDGERHESVDHDGDETMEDGGEA